MTLPQHPDWVVEIGWGANPWDFNVSWSDVSSYVRAFTTRRGRSDELARFDTGTATLTLDNRDGRFLPISGKPYYPYVRPMVPIRIMARFPVGGSGDFEEIPVFRGHVESFSYAWTGTADAVAKLSVSDPFKLLAMRQYQWEPANEQQVDQRLYEAMTGPDAGPNLRRLHIDPVWLNIIGGASPAVGSVRISALMFVDYTGVEYGQLLALAEGGRFFANREGKFEFHHKGVYWFEPWATTAMTLGDGGPIGVNAGLDPSNPAYEFGYRALEPSYDDAKVYNRSNVLGHGQVFFGENLLSQARYGYREMKWPDMPFEQDIYGQNLAQWIVTHYGEPRLRVATVNMQPDSREWWRRALDLEIGRKVTLRRRPPGGGLIEQPSYIERVQIDATPQKQTIQWTLAPSLWEGPWAQIGVFYMDDELRRVYVVGGGGSAPDWHPEEL
jgi:hypothetical protein